MAGLALWHRIHFSPPKTCPWLSEKVTAANKGMDKNRVAMATGIITRVFIIELDGWHEFWRTRNQVATSTGK
jgi:hypothetical protein